MKELTYSEWVKIGKEKGFHDYHKDMVDIAVREQLTKDTINVGMLRQWLNEDRIDDLNKMVTNEDLLDWLIDNK